VADELTPVAGLVQKIITTTAGMCLGIIVVWGVSTLADVKERVTVIESREYPPRYIKDQIRILGEEARRCQMQIDRLESEHQGIERKHLEPYSWLPDDFDLGENG
jgi:hypothetical protein